LVGLLVERDVGLCCRREPDKSTDSDPAGQEGKGAAVFSRVREQSCTVPRICGPGFSFRILGDASTHTHPGESVPER